MNVGEQTIRELIRARHAQDVLVEECKDGLYINTLSVRRRVEELERLIPRPLAHQINMAVDALTRLQAEIKAAESKDEPARTG